MKKVIYSDNDWFTIDYETGELIGKFDTYSNSYKVSMNTYKKKLVETDEEKLEKMDIKTIENFLRRKKLQNINK